MCVNTTVILNKKFLGSKKNGYKTIPCPNDKFKYIEIPCGKCYECRKKRAREWSIRINEEIKGQQCDFVSFTFNNDELEKLANEHNLNIENNEDLNQIATISIKRMLGRYRKKHKVSIKHWCITERGTKSTERLHIHGIFFNTLDRNYKNYWKYGNIYIGKYCNETTAAYVVKYMLKENEKHPEFRGKILTSAGIGKQFINGRNEQCFNYEQTNEYYRFQNGTKCNLPKYYREKLYTEEQRYYLWEKIIDKGEKYIGGEKLINATEQEIASLKKYYKNKYTQIHGDKYNEWDKQKAKRKHEKYIKHKKLYNLPSPPFLESKEG